ncbi:HNH endonuclease [Rhizobium laguerreae]
MRRLRKPTITTEDIFADCVSATDDEDLKGRLTAIEDLLVTASSTYEVHANNDPPSLNAVDRVGDVGEVSKDELTGLYSNHMSATKGAARWAYDLLRNSAPNLRCPLCGVGTVATLDHHLPKSKYPDLSIAPLNLVPACHYCNDSKKSSYPKTAGKQTIHPYFDDFTQERWVYADIVAGPPLAITFRASPPTNWSQTDQQKAIRHFQICKLGVLFTSNANDDLVTLRSQLADIGTAQKIRSHLAGEATRFAPRLNSWQHALYSTLASDEWFIEGGYENISDKVDYVGD